MAAREWREAGPSTAVGALSATAAGDSRLAGLSREMAAHHSVRAVIRLDGIAAARLDRPDEGARKHDLSRLERKAERAELVREPGDAVRRMVEDARGEPGFLEHPIAVAERADPAQISVERTEGATARDDAGMAALSAMVSTILRVALVTASTRSILVSRISSAGTTKSVEFSASKMVQPGPASRAFMTKASSASTRVAMKRSLGILPPSVKNMSSKRIPESGSSMPSADCIAFEVKPILWPRISRPSATFCTTQARWIA